MPTTSYGGVAGRPAGGTYGGGNDPNIYGSDAYKAKQLADEQKRVRDEMEARQAEIARQDQIKMTQRAQQLALQEAERLRLSDSNPRTTTGTQMEISNYGGGSSSGGSGSRSGSSGGGGGYDAAPVPPKSPQQQAYEMSQAMQQLYSSMPQPAMPQYTRTPPPVVPELTGPSAAFSRAKDASGRTGAAAIRSLKDLMTRRGMSDAGIEGSGEAQILSGVQQQQAEAEYGAADQDADRRWESAKLGYGGDSDYNNMLYQSQLADRSRQQQMITQLLSQIRY